MLRYTMVIEETTPDILEEGTTITHVHFVMDDSLVLHDGEWVNFKEVSQFYLPGDFIEIKTGE